MPLFFLIAGFFSRLAFHRKGANAFFRGRIIRLLIPFVVGWLILWPLIRSGWIIGWNSMRGETDFLAGLRESYAAFANLPEGLFVQTHLWFLYYLMGITGAFFILRFVLSFAKPVTSWIDRSLQAILPNSLSILFLAIPTGGLLWLMHGWGLDTPSESLTPHYPLAAVYGGFFTLGWWLHKNSDLLPAITGITWTRGILAIVAAATALSLGDIMGDTGHPRYDQARAGFTAAYAVMMWSMVLLSIGLFRKCLNKSYRSVRYIADASYWMYLIHLPIILYLQILVAEWSMPWYLKLTLISVVTIGVCLLSYQLIVRHTWIGRVLHGKRK